MQNADLNDNVLAGDAPLVDDALQAVRRHTTTSTLSVERELDALRADIMRVRDSVTLIVQESRHAAAKMVRERPLSLLAGVAGVAFLLGVRRR